MAVRNWKILSWNVRGINAEKNGTPYEIESLIAFVMLCVSRRLSVLLLILPSFVPSVPPNSIPLSTCPPTVLQEGP